MGLSLNDRSLQNWLLCLETITRYAQVFDANIPAKRWEICIDHACRCQSQLV